MPWKSEFDVVYLLLLFIADHFSSHFAASCYLWSSCSMLLFTIILQLVVIYSCFSAYCHLQLSCNLLFTVVYQLVVIYCVSCALCHRYDHPLFVSATNTRRALMLAKGEEVEIAEACDSHWWEVCHGSSIM